MKRAHLLPTAPTDAAAAGTPNSEPDSERGSASRARFRIRVSDPDLTQRLNEFLSWTAFRPERVEPDVVEVVPPEGVPERVARAELGLRLEVWRRKYPDVEVTLE